MAVRARDGDQAAMKNVTPTLGTGVSLLPPGGGGSPWGGPAAHVAPTLGTDVSSLPPEGAGSPWGGPAANRSFRPAACLVAALLAACGNTPKAPDWQLESRGALERFVPAYMDGNARVAQAEFDRARREVAATGKIDLIARVELMRCAARVASLVVEPCTGFEALRADAPAAERAYADYLAAHVAPADVALLPPPQRAVAALVAAVNGPANGASNGTTNGAVGAAAAAGDAAVPAVQDPLSRLVAAGVLLQAGRAGPGVIAAAVDTASAQGWRRPLLAWLGVQLRRAEAAGAKDEADRIRRRMALVAGEH